MSKYIKNLIHQGEHQQLDFKFEISDAKKIARTIAAFANTDGGKLLIGVKDNGIISGVRAEEEIYMIESAAHLFCCPAVQYKTQQWNVDGKSVLEVIIPKSIHKPHYSLHDHDRWKAYIRKQDHNHLVNHVQLEVWKKQKAGKGILVKYGRAEKKLLDYLQKHDRISLTGFRKTASVNRYKAELILIKLISIGIISIDYTDKGIYYELNREIFPESFKQND